MNNISFQKELLTHQGYTYGVFEIVFKVDIERYFRVGDFLIFINPDRMNRSSQLFRILSDGREDLTYYTFSLF